MKDNSAAAMAWLTKMPRWGLLWMLFSAPAVFGCRQQTALPTAATMSFAAEVESYETSVEWDHFDDGSFATFDQLNVRVVTPSVFKGRPLKIRIASDLLPSDSSLREEKAILIFQMPAKMVGEAKIDWGNLLDPHAIR